MKSHSTIRHCELTKTSQSCLCGEANLGKADMGKFLYCWDTYVGQRTCTTEAASTKSMMERNATNTTPTNVNVDEGVERIELNQQYSSTEEPQVFFEQEKKESATSILKHQDETRKSFSLVTLMSPGGHKRKSSDGRREEEWRRWTEENVSSISHDPILLDQESSNISINQGERDEDDEKETSRQVLSMEMTKQSPRVAMGDDLQNTSFYTTSNTPPRKYRRRNSIFIHRDSKDTSSILRDIHIACSSDSIQEACMDFHKDHDKSICPGTAFTRVGRRRANSLDATASPSRVNSDDNASGIQEWGNATWANSEDTNWFSELSSLSFHSRPTIPPSPLAAVSCSEDTEEASAYSSTSMAPPPPLPRRKSDSESQGPRKSSNEEGTECGET